VETLVSIYVGALDGDDLAANVLIDEAMGEARAWMTATLPSHVRNDPTS